MKKLIEKIKLWASTTALNWLKKEWMQIVNILVIMIAYSKTDSLPGLQAVVGLWLFILLAYYIFWQFFGVGKLLKLKQ